MVAQYASTHKWLGARVGARVAGMRMGGPLWSPACPGYRCGTLFLHPKSLLE